MKFKRGSKVEVLDKREVPSGSWLCAEVISGNGDYYSVKYDCYSDNAGVTVERVPRGAIRPRPPSVLYTRCWVPGDIVEVFEKNSWKLAEVLNVVKGKYFFVRLIGYSRKLRAHMSDLRPRQVWEDNGWIVIQKEGGNDRFMNSQSKAGDDRNRMPQSGIEGKSSGHDDQFSHKYEGGLDECGWVTLESKKRRQCLYSPQMDTCTGARKKMRFVKKMEKSQRALGTVSSHLLEKVDADASSQIIHDAKCLSASLKYRTSRFCETDVDEQKQNTSVGYNFVGCLEHNDAKSTCSSVGSCNVSSGLNKSLDYLITSQTHGTHSHYDDTASSHESGSENSLLVKEGLPEETHCLELNAYHSTVMALYASGPLSWDKEVLLTNLRIMLNISNDEHLLELKNLTSAKNRYLS